jgi:hypothetical protein
MFSTDYNRKIAEQVNQINNDFIKHSKKVNRIGGGLLNVAEVDKTSLARPIGGAKKSKLEGDGFFGDIWDGVKSIFGGSIPDELLEDVEPVVEGGKKGRKKGGVAFPEVVEGGRKKYVKKVVKGKKKGGNILDDLVDDIGKVAPILPLVALGKPKKGRAEPVEGGKKKKSSSWIEHVKAYAKKHNMKYPDALKDAKCKASYRKN